MICSICHSPFREDLAFARDMLSINDPRRQFRCYPNGHSVTVPAPAGKPSRAGAAGGAASSRRVIPRARNTAAERGRSINPDRYANKELAMAGLGRRAAR